LLQKIRELSRDSAIYGLGDVAISAVNFLLLPIYVQYLSPSDYGVLGLLGGVEVAAKILFRWGLDGSFMRFFYDCDDAPARQRLASTIFFFLLAANGVLLAAALLAAPWLAGLIFDDPQRTLTLQLVLANTFAIAFTFFPFHVLRMERRAVQFSVLTLVRSAATVVLRILLVVGLGLGVLGVVLADTVVTALVMTVLIRWFTPLIRPMFSQMVLRETLAFGLPRLPHAAAQQVIAVADKFILGLYRPIADVGMYTMGVSFGLTQKLFLSAFEYAWAPFYYATSREPDAPAVFRTVTTYGIAALAVITAGLAASARDLLDLLTNGIFVEAAGVVGLTAIGVLFQGIYLLTSIGLNITKNTHYYPVSTLTAAAANVALNFALVPRYGMMGAAWASAAAYAVQAGLAFRFSQRVYPVEHEYGRILRIALAGMLGFTLATAIPPLPPLAGILARAGTTVAVFGALLGMTGFFKPEEMRTLARLRQRRQRAPVTGVQVHSVSAPETTEFAGEIVSAELPEQQPAVLEPAADRRSGR
jgi:O-antigen/teichoic acid export membrane protein